MVIIALIHTKIWQNVKLNQVGVCIQCSKSLVYYVSWKSYLVIIDPNSHEKLSKIEII